MSATARGMGRMLALYGVIVGGSPSLAASLVGGEWRFQLACGPVRVSIVAATYEEAEERLLATLRQSCARLLAEVPFEGEVAIAAG